MRIRLNSDSLVSESEAMWMHRENRAPPSALRLLPQSHIESVVFSCVLLLLVALAVGTAVDSDGAAVTSVEGS